LSNSEPALSLLPQRERLPNFVIIGAFRSGTTSLARNVGSHPQAFMAAQKEVRFFTDHYELGLDWYKRQFAGASNEPAVGEASPVYMYSGKAMARMAAAIPEARLVAILRNPIDRAYSHYWMMRSRGQEPLEFPDAIADELNRIIAGNGPPAYLAYGRYLRHLRVVCEHFPRENLHVIVFERFRDDPVEHYRSLCRFLGVDDSFVPPNLEQPVNNFVRVRSTGLRVVSRRLFPPIRRVLDRVNVRPAKYPPLDQGVREALARELDQDNRDLASWLGLEHPLWPDAGGPYSSKEKR
jgi:hypothetical protein